MRRHRKPARPGAVLLRVTVLLVALPLLVRAVAQAAPAPAPAEAPAAIPSPKVGGDTRPAPLPNELDGHWTIRTAVGEQPLMLEAPSARALVGKQVDIGERLKLWTIFSGKVVAYAVTQGTLLDYLQVKSAPPPSDVPQGGRTFVFYEIATSDCSSHGKPLSGCPILTLVRDPSSGEVGLVTFPGGLALFGPPSKPQIR